MNFAADHLVSWRMAAQLLQEPSEHNAQQVVAWLGGVQAQDIAGAKWSIGIRMPGTPEAKIESALADGHIVRTWAFRGTLHLVAASDVHGLLALLAPRLIASNQRRYTELDLDETAFSRSNSLIRSALENAQALTRSEICSLLEAGGVSSEGQRAPYLLQRAALDAVICLGPRRGRGPTYALLSPQVNGSSTWDRNHALAALAERYFTSHGPATIQDFCWWSGLPTPLARQALEHASGLLPITVDGTELWAGCDQPAVARESAHLLPAFDEYLLGYSDRSAALDPAFRMKVNAGGGMLRPTIIVDGKVIGVWNQTTKKGRIVISPRPFGAFGDGERRAIERAAQRYGRYRNTAVELQEPNAR